MIKKRGFFEQVKEFPGVVRDRKARERVEQEKAKKKDQELKNMDKAAALLKRKKK